MEHAVASFREALESLDRVQADNIFHKALLELSPIEAVEQVVVPALEQIGAAWDSGGVALSQVYMSGRFCEELVDRMLPPSDPDRNHQPRSAIVVLSDYHDLGTSGLFTRSCGPAGLSCLTTAAWTWMHWWSASWQTEFAC